MGLLKNIVKNGISNGINNGISKGISKGISDALGKAVEKAVNPAAERLAGKAAAQLDEATAALDSSAQAASEAAEGVEAAKKAGGFAALENALNGWAKNAEQYATELSKSLKICPKCGEAAPADKEFCPHCGTKLPETTAAAAYVCPKCGKQNTVGSEFCGSCGTKLPGAESASVDVMADWDTKLAGFPKWELGGTDFLLDENGLDPNGHPYYAFTVFNSSIDALNAYLSLLKRSGFRQKYRGSDQVLLKTSGSSVWAVGSVDAMYDDTTVCLSFSRDPAEVNP